MRRFILCCLCLVTAAPGVAADEVENAPARRSYIYFSKGNLPEGTARMAADDLKAAKPTKAPSASVAHKASFESIDELGYDYPSPLSSPMYAPVYGSPTTARLSGTRYGYSYAGHRYAAHCFTAPGYESACCDSTPCHACPEYRIQCRTPGLLGCLFGCHEPYCRVVKVRPPRIRRELCSARVAGVPLPSFLLADIERYELPSTGSMGTAALPNGLEIEEQFESPAESRLDRQYGPAVPLTPTPVESAAPVPAPLPGTAESRPVDEESLELPELSTPR